MNRLLPIAPVLCRPARPADRAQAFAFLRQIWDGTDYLPEVWDEWIEDPAGLFAAAEQGGRVVGLGRLAAMGWGEGWLEGLRVDPRAEGRGVGSRLHDYLVAAWARGGGRALRLATHTSRTPVHRMCARTGFERIGEVVKHVAGARPGAPRLVPHPTPDAGRVAAWFARSPATGGLIEIDWKWAAPARERLMALAEKGWLWDWAGGRGALLAEPDLQSDPPALRLYGLAPGDGDLSDLLADCRCLADAQGLSQARWLAPGGAGIGEALEAAGYAPDWEAPVVLYEKRR